MFPTITITFVSVLEFETQWTSTWRTSAPSSIQRLFSSKRREEGVIKFSISRIMFKPRTSSFSRKANINVWLKNDRSLTNRSRSVIDHDRLEVCFKNGIFCIYLRTDWDNHVRGWWLLFCVFDDLSESQEEAVTHYYEINLFEYLNATWYFNNTSKKIVLDQCWFYIFLGY